MSQNLLHGDEITELYNIIRTIDDTCYRRLAQKIYHDNVVEDVIVTSNTVEKIGNTDFRCGAINCDRLYIRENHSYNILYGADDSLYLLTNGEKDSVEGLGILRIDNSSTGYRKVIYHYSYMDVLFFLTEDNEILIYSVDGSESTKLRLGVSEGCEIKPVWFFFTLNFRWYLDVDGVISVSCSYLKNEKPYYKLHKINHKENKVKQIVCNGRIIYFTNEHGSLYVIKEYTHYICPQQWKAEEIKIIGMSPISCISLSSTHLLASSKHDGKLYGIGDNSKNQIRPTTEIAYRILVPIVIKDETGVEIRVKNIHCCKGCSYIVDDKCRLFCFGDNRYSQLGYNRDVISVKYPTVHPISVNLNINHVYGKDIIFVVRTDGTVVVFSDINESGIYELPHFHNRLVGSGSLLVKNTNK